MTSKFQLISSCIICRLELSAQNLKHHFNARHNLDKIVLKCEICGNQVSKYSKRFCSKSCSTKSSNFKRDYSSSRATGLRCCKLPTVTKISWCEVCGKPHTRLGKSCSDICKREILSKEMKKKILSGFNPNLNRGRGRQSYLERSFEQWIKLNFPEIEFKSEYAFSRKDTSKTYFADFYFPSLNIIVELDGSQHLKTKETDEERDRYIKDVYNISTFRISHSEYKSKERLQELWSILSGSNRCL